MLSYDLNKVFKQVGNKIELSSLEVYEEYKQEYLTLVSELSKVAKQEVEKPLGNWDINKPEEIYLLDLKILEGKTISYYALTKVCDLIEAKHIEEIENFWDLDININDGGTVRKLQTYKDEGLDKPSLQTISSKLIIDDVALNALRKHDYGLCYIAEYMGIALMVADNSSLTFVLDYLSKPIDFKFSDGDSAVHKTLLSLREKSLLRFKSGELENTLVQYFLCGTKLHDRLLDALVLLKKDGGKRHSSMKGMNSF